MLRKTLVAALTVTAFAASLAAQSKPNFSGTWKLNVSKSEFGPLPSPDSRTDVIEHNDPVLKVSTSAESAQGKQNFNVTYTTDGKEVVNKQGPREIKSTVVWDGSNLVVNSKFSFNDQDVTIKNVWTLSADGKTLTQNAHLAAQMGEVDQKMVYEKQEGGAVTATVPAAKPTAPSASAASGGRPDYSGTWKLNVSKSDFGPLPAPDVRTDVIDHKEPSLKTTTSQDGPQGKQEFTLAVTTDGKEATNNAGGTELKSTGGWEGNNLVINTKLKFQDNDVAIKSVWLLTDGGKTLTQNAHITSPLGELDQKMVFEKQ
ncbi:MAG TPA: hypothetical protein VIX89_12585 [Bryobacteraceae bacterium]